MRVLFESITYSEEVPFKGEKEQREFKDSGKCHFWICFKGVRQKFGEHRVHLAFRAPGLPGAEEWWYTSVKMLCSLLTLTASGNQGVMFLPSAEFDSHLINVMGKKLMAFYCLLQ